MLEVHLTHTKTYDGVRLDGIVVLPRKKSNTALVWIHGFGSNFSHGQTLAKDLSARCSQSGIAYFKFNTRGHDIVNRETRKGKGLHGAGLERFEDCVLDVRAIILYARTLGYKKIILAGHSTGANKVLYYLYKTEDPAIRGLILLGPVNDVAAGRKKFGRAGLARGIALAEKIARKDPEAIMPLSYGVYSARRFLSIFWTGTEEDVFPYLNQHAEWKELKSVRVPLAVIFGSRDEYLDRPAHKIIDVFRAHAPLSKSFSGAIIKGANHGFRRKEKEVTHEIIRWIKSNGL